MISMGELMYGTDEDFVTNCYLAAFGRWPDQAGFEYHLALLAEAPGQRDQLLHKFLTSEEAAQKQRAISPDPGPVTAQQALAAQLRMRTAVLRADMIQLRETPASLAAGSAVAGEVAALGAALESLAREMRERMSALEAALAGRIPTAPNLSPAVSLDYVNDVIEAAQAQLNHRLRAIEKRLIEPDGSA